METRSKGFCRLSSTLLFRVTSVATPARLVPGSRRPANSARSADTLMWIMRTRILSPRLED